MQLQHVRETQSDLFLQWEELYAAIREDEVSISDAVYTRIQLHHVQDSSRFYCGARYTYAAVGPNSWVPQWLRFHHQVGDVPLRFKFQILQSTGALNPSGCGWG